MSNEGTVNEKYTKLIAQYRAIQNDNRMKNSVEFQTDLTSLIKEFELIDHMISSLDLFSENEFFEEINVNYLPFLNVEYYLAELYLYKMSDKNVSHIGIEYKTENLTTSKKLYTSYLQRLTDLEMLNPLQLKQKQGYVLSREEKIEQYKYEKELKHKIANVDKIEDEDEKRQVYIDEIHLYTLSSLNQLVLVDMELKVLSNRPTNPQSKDVPKTQAQIDDYSTKLDKIPQNQKINQLLKNGKILQPFTITRKELQSKVFGTGQVLPSMTVEEYLDYELANGKMLKPEEPSKGSDEEDEDDEEEELSKREWDDWKDDNPKGSGNTMNLG